MRQLLSFLRRDAAIAASYGAATWLPLVHVLVTVPLIACLARVFAGTDAEPLGPYRRDYFAFLLLGMAFQDYVTLSMSAFLHGIREHQMMGTLEVVLLSPTPVTRILLYSSVWGYLFHALRFALYLGVGSLFGLDLSAANFTSFALLALAANASFAALGILAAAGTLLLKQATSVMSFFTAATLAFGGVAYPITVLPGWLQDAALLVPFTHALLGLRKALLLGAAPADLLGELGALALFAAVLFPAALLAFRAALQRAKMAGTLAQA